MLYGILSLMKLENSTLVLLMRKIGIKDSWKKDFQKKIKLNRLLKMFQLAKLILLFLKAKAGVKNNKALLKNINMTFLAVKKKSMNLNKTELKDTNKEKSHKRKDIKLKNLKIKKIKKLKV